MSKNALLRKIAEHPRNDVKDVRLEKALQLHFYLLALRIVDRERMLEVQPDHLTWLLEQEQAGVVFLSGPASHAKGDSRPDRQCNGFLAIRAASANEAAAIADREPFIAQGVMQYELYEWTVYQGSIAVSVQISDGTGNMA